MSIHRRTHPAYIEGCWQCRISSVGIAPSATPTRSPHAAETKAREERWSKDMPAYKRLRQNGTQPRCIDGCAELEAKAASPEEIQIGITNIPPNRRPEVHDAVVLSNEMGVPA